MTRALGRASRSIAVRFQASNVNMHNDCLQTTTPTPNVGKLQLDDMLLSTTCLCVLVKLQQKKCNTSQAYDQRYIIKIQSLIKIAAYHCWLQVM